MSKAVQQYLTRHAEPESSSLDNFPKQFEHVLCVPAFNEALDFFIPWFDQGPCDETTLLIININCPDNLSYKEIQDCQSQIKHYQNNFNLLWQHPDNSSIQLIQKDLCHILLVDRVNHAIPHKQGVGLARKIIADMALQLINLNFVRSSWIYCTDADVTLPANYFYELPDAKKYSAITFPFTHTLANSYSPSNIEITNTPHSYSKEDQHVYRLTLLYEASIRYYVEKLLQAGSPYAINSIGSIMALSAQSYAEVRGFPKRNGAEDFYLLNKLAKLKDVKEVNTDQILIRSRVSRRVPFGTGPAVNDLMQSSHPLDDPIFYHPEIFSHLQQVIKHLNSSASVSIATLPTLTLALNSIGYLEALKKITANHTSNQDRSRALHGWFDGFRTLKFVHYLRDNGYPDLSWNTLYQFKPREKWYFPHIFKQLEGTINLLSTD